MQYYRVRTTHSETGEERQICVAVTSSNEAEEAACQVAARMGDFFGTTNNRGDYVALELVQIA